MCVFSYYTTCTTHLCGYSDICQMLTSVTTIADICDDVDHLLVRNGHLLGREQESLGPCFFSCAGGPPSLVLNT